MKEAIQFHLRTSRSYLILAQSLRSEYYKSVCLEQLALAHTLIKEYNEFYNEIDTYLAA